MRDSFLIETDIIREMDGVYPSYKFSPPLGSAYLKTALNEFVETALGERIVVIV